jgi:hypothetical protein
MAVRQVLQQQVPDRHILIDRAAEIARDQARRHQRCEPGIEADLVTPALQYRLGKGRKRHLQDQACGRIRRRPVVVQAEPDDARHQHLTIGEDRDLRYRTAVEHAGLT